ncbi:hypothetical protein [Verrucomicrobium spinosum]|uniref:hypothetical protein n=1 Tax=Verrucomicrobium spinosum TaxID=2736 RepID=UPI000AF3B34F|nr:hypothetical protein [Verrucomicrobium spinosum]
MTSHLRWSLHVLYLLLFWPSRYKADIGLQVDISLKSRLRHMTRMVPALMFLALVGSCVLALTIHCINGAPIFWPGILPGVVAGVLVGAACFLLVSDTVMATTMALSMGLLWGITGLEYLGLPRTLVVQATGLSGALWLSCSTGIVIAITSSLGRPPLPALWIRLFLALIGTAFFALFGLGVAMNAGLSKAVCALSSSMSFLVSFIVVHFRLFDYPIYALQSWSLAKASSQPNADVSRLWKKHPLAWNEVIWLPLPGVVTFLANLVKSDRDFGYEIISFVSAHRRHQARAVSAALSEVMLQDLQVTAFNQFPEVLRRLEWLRTPPKRLPQIAVQHGPAFVRIAEHAAHRLALTSREQQLQSLDRGATEIEQLQRSTMGTPDVLASRLLQCAMDWQSLFRMNCAEPVTTCPTSATSLISSKLAAISRKKTPSHSLVVRTSGINWRTSCSLPRRPQRFS